MALPRNDALETMLDDDSPYEPAESLVTLIEEEVKAKIARLSAPESEPAKQERWAHFGIAQIFRHASVHLAGLIDTDDEIRRSGQKNAALERKRHDLLEKTLSAFRMLSEMVRDLRVYREFPETAKITKMIHIVKILLAGGVVYDRAAEAAGLKQIERGQVISLAELKKRRAADGRSTSSH